MTHSVFISVIVLIVNISVRNLRAESAAENDLTLKNRLSILGFHYFGVVVSDGACYFAQD
jgi:hypothetical protein